MWTRLLVRTTVICVFLVFLYSVYSKEAAVVKVMLRFGYLIMRLQVYHIILEKQPSMPIEDRLFDRG